MKQSGNQIIPTSAEMANIDAKKLKRKGIKSPNVNEMESLKRGNTTYYFKSEEKKQRFIENNPI